MSLSVEKIPITLVEDPRVAFPEWEMPARYGGPNINYYQQPSSGVGPGSFSFQVQLPDPAGSVVCPDLIMYNSLSMAVNLGAGGAANLFNQGTTDALRAFPITSCINNLNVLINGTTVQYPNMSDIGHVLRRFNPRAHLWKSANFSPFFPDNCCANYNDLIGTNRNPLAAGASGDYDMTRGAYGRVRYTNDGTNPTYAGTIVFETWEPINNV